MWQMIRIVGTIACRLDAPVSPQKTGPLPPLGPVGGAVAKLRDDARRIDATPQADDAASVGGATAQLALLTRDTQAIRDGLQGLSLPAEAHTAVSELKDAVEVLQQLLAQVPTPMDDATKEKLRAAVQAVQRRAQQLQPFLDRVGKAQAPPASPPADPKAIEARARGKASQILQADSGAAILTALRATKDPAEMRALIGALQAGGMDYLALFNMETVSDSPSWA